MWINETPSLFRTLRDKIKRVRLEKQRLYLEQAGVANDNGGQKKERQRKLAMWMIIILAEGYLTLERKAI